MYFLPSSASACRVTTARRGVFKNGLARSLQRERIIGSCLVTIPNTTCFVDSISTCVQCDSHTVEDGQELANDVALSPFGHQETAPNERSYTIWMTSRKSKTRMLRVIEILLTLPTIEMLGSTVLDLFSSAVCHCRLMLSPHAVALRTYVAFTNLEYVSVVVDVFIPSKNRNKVLHLRLSKSVRRCVDLLSDLSHISELGTAQYIRRCEIVELRRGHTGNG